MGALAVLALGACVASVDRTSPAATRAQRPERSPRRGRADASPPPALEHPRLQETVLPSGLRLLLDEDPHATVAGAVTMVPGGSTADPPGAEGLAHLVEHLVYRAVDPPSPPAPAAPAAPGAAAGRQDITRRDAFTHDAVVAMNAHTTPDCLLFYEFGPPSRLEDLLGLTIARMADPLVGVSEEAFALERRIIGAESRFREDTRRTAWAANELYPVLFPPPHPYARPTGGTEDSRRKLTLVEARGYAARTFRPERMTLLVSTPPGATSLAAIAARLPPALRGDAAHPVARPARAAPAPEPPGPPLPAAKLERRVSPLPTPELWIAWPLPDGYGVNGPAEEVLAPLGAGGRRVGAGSSGGTEHPARRGDGAARAESQCAVRSRAARRGGGSRPGRTRGDGADCEHVGARAGGAAAVRATQELLRDLPGSGSTDAASARARRGDAGWPRRAPATDGGRGQRPAIGREHGGRGVGVSAPDPRESARRHVHACAAGSPARSVRASCRTSRPTTRPRRAARRRRAVERRRAGGPRAPRRDGDQQEAAHRAHDRDRAARGGGSGWPGSCFAAGPRTPTHPFSPSSRRASGPTRREATKLHMLVGRGRRATCRSTGGASAGPAPGGADAAVRGRTAAGHGVAVEGRTRAPARARLATEARRRERRIGVFARCSPITHSRASSAPRTSTSSRARTSTHGWARPHRRNAAWSSSAAWIPSRSSVAATILARQMKAPASIAGSSGGAHAPRGPRHGQIRSFESRRRRPARHADRGPPRLLAAAMATAERNSYGP